MHLLKKKLKKKKKKKTDAYNLDSSNNVKYSKT